MHEVEQFIHKVSWFSFVCFLSLIFFFFKKQNIPMSPRVASHWVSYFSLLGRSNDKRVPPCRAFLTWLLRLVTSFQKYEAEIVSWKYTHLGHISALFIFEILLFFMWGVECVSGNVHMSIGVRGGIGFPRAEVTGNSDLHGTVLRTKFKTSASLVEALDNWAIPPAFHIFFALAASRKSSKHGINVIN